MPKVSKIISLQNLCNISKRKWGIKLIFMHTNIKVNYKLILSILLSILLQYWFKKEVSHKFFFDELIRQCHGNNLLHISTKDFSQLLFLFKKLRWTGSSNNVLFFNTFSQSVGTEVWLKLLKMIVIMLLSLSEECQIFYFCEKLLSDEVLDLFQIPITYDF